MDKTSIIFGNPIDKKTIKQAQNSKKKYLKKYGDDSVKDYFIDFSPIKPLENIGVTNIITGNKNHELKENALIVGNIRMGFGHYRISIAMASCAKALGYTPYWLDLASFDATGSKMIREQNDLYSLASKISQKSRLFNHFVWEPLNSEGFKKLTYNAKDQMNASLLTPLLKHIPKDTPYIATHVWPSQAAIHAGFTHVVNAIPDNWPMALHLSEGAIHTVQTPFAYAGYKTLDGFAKKQLKGIPDDELFMVGHYVDHELLSELEKDNRARLNRIESKEPLRILLTVGGAGAGYDLFKSLLSYLEEPINKKEVCVFINFGDHLGVYNKLIKELPFIKDGKKFFNDYLNLIEYVNKGNEEVLDGVVTIYNENIFEAVYSTNLFMHITDLLITKPSELVFYPVPKLFMRHIGGHEVYGGIHGHEFGDALKECASSKELCTYVDYIRKDRALLKQMIKEITRLKEAGYYDGAYECVKLACQVAGGIDNGK